MVIQKIRYETKKEFETLESALKQKEVSGYDEEYKISTTQEDQDTKAIDVVITDSESTDHVVASNCTDTCSKALESAGKSSGSTINESILQIKTYAAAFLQKTRSKNYLPLAILF